MRIARSLRAAATLLAACTGAALIAAPSAVGDPTHDRRLVVRLDRGLIRGTDTGLARVFSGIRYAAPPVGRLRWAYPLPATPWRGIRDATRPGNRCPQTGAYASATEDCLFLNVTTPRQPSDKPLPVMVWLHGGGYTHGAGSLYDAQRIASQGNVIVVTVNYRLGVFGYFGYPGLPGSGNFGLADQIAALRWVQRNARAFGGDRHNVTLFGQSAGAMSACALLSSPAVAGLFDKAILSSGSCLLDWPTGVLYPTATAQTPYTSRATSLADGAALAETLGCGSDRHTMACLRQKPVSALLPHTGDFSNHLTYHTPLLPRNPADALRLGLVHRVPVVSGGNRAEMRSFIAGAAAADPITPERYPRLLRQAFGAKATVVARRYPLSEFASPALAWAAVTTDSAWSCPTSAADRLLARHTPVYAYEFADEHAPNLTPFALPGLPQSPRSLGVAHATELPYLFDLGGRRLPLAPAQRELANQMITYWTAFAHSGTPNTEGSPHWPRFTGHGPVQRLAPNAVHPTDYSIDHHCGFWRRVASSERPHEHH